MSPDLGLPEHELSRSAAARRTGELAAASGLFLANFEHRVELELPETWCPEGRADLGSPPSWDSGVLPESKYHSFRYERRIGSFHPGHRAKWGAHELCHGVVGFAWRRGAPMRYHAVAARIAEALPVTLWYFLDEDGLRRCPNHRGPLFSAWCARCDAAARHGADEPDGRWTNDGLTWLNGELDAAWRSWRTGTQVPHRHATLDLASDGLAYAAAHGPRLRSDGFAEALECLFPGGAAHGWFADLEGLLERVRECASHLAGHAVAAPLAGDRDRWVAQDLGLRLAQLREDTAGDARAELSRFIERLGEAPAAHGAVAEEYRALAEDYELPPAEVALAMGHTYASTVQVEAGLQSALPVAVRLLGRRFGEVAAAFAAEDRRERRPLGRRFAEWLTHPGVVQDVVRYEAALAHAAPADLEALTLAVDGPPWCLSPAAELLRFDADIPSFVEALGKRPAGGGDTSVVVTRSVDGDVYVVPVSEGSAAALRAGAVSALPEASALLGAGALRVHAA